METFEKHKKIWRVIIIIAGTALIATSFIPYLVLLK
jgi:hypothetical protein